MNFGFIFLPAKFCLAQWKVLPVSVTVKSQFHAFCRLIMILELGPDIVIKFYNLKFQEEAKEIHASCTMYSPPMVFFLSCTQGTFSGWAM